MKSRSFMNLLETGVGTEKTVHPFNEKRKMLRWWSESNLSGYYKWSSQVSMPVLLLIEDEGENDAGEEEEECRRGADWPEQSSPGKNRDRRASKLAHAGASGGTSGIAETGRLSAPISLAATVTAVCFALGYDLLGLHTGGSTEDQNEEENEAEG
ncbi:hypothetical protein SAY86_007754 [Trapa natans]|uniref:Uncharacterized protein n=1 Tax=Trapa natans TaxID=22666 RepID=A0AAN7R0K1_TRANT|nr:hypothetical protein SAY86_007754 [Trapa natans]